jgi:L-ascorbate metabolism protein UlaG (beta-lactamase superfamily)
LIAAAIATMMRAIQAREAEHMKITWFGHSAFRVEIANSVVLIDPFLSGNPVYDGSVEDAARGVTHVALTHGHGDHIGDTAQICKDTGATLIAVFEVATYLNAQGAENLEPGNTGGTIYTEDFDITFVRADHSSSSADGVYLGNPCGLVVRAKAEGKTLYHMGDTDIFGDMALIAELLPARHRHRADRRPLHHERAHRRGRLPAVLQLLDHPALPLPDVPDAGPVGRQLR